VILLAVSIAADGFRRGRLSHEAAGLMLPTTRQLQLRHCPVKRREYIAADLSRFRGYLPRLLQTMV
jgi:hypothetical protein